MYDYDIHWLVIRNACPSKSLDWLKLWSPYHVMVNHRIHVITLLNFDLYATAHAILAPFYSYKKSVN